MKNISKKSFVLMMLLVLILPLLSVEKVEAKNSEDFYMGGDYTDIVKMSDESYSNPKKMGKNDVHSGWTLGEFKITGWSSVENEADGTPVFMKNTNDKISLSYLLNQDIEKINGDEALSIGTNKKSYNEAYGIPRDARLDFGLGTCIIKKTDSENKKTTTNPYINYLMGVKKGACTDVQLLEEGDYEVVLDYVVNKNAINVGPVSTLPLKSYYQVKINFKIRNANTVVFLFDQQSKSSLNNGDLAESGFYVDFANSKYLTVTCLKEKLVNNNGQINKTVSKNFAVKDGNEYTDEGIYTLNVHNKYTDADTQMVIYVGQDKYVKALAALGGSLEKLNEYMADGATVNDDGNIVLKTNEVVRLDQNVKNDVNTINESSVDNDSGSTVIYVFIVLAVVIVLGLVVFFVVKAKKEKKN